MSIISIVEQLDTKQYDAWLRSVTANILRVLNVFKEECSDISAMVEAHGDKDRLNSGSVYGGIGEYFSEEPIFITAEDNNLHSDIEDIAPSKYVLILEVTEDVWEEAGPGDTPKEFKCKRGKLTYVKKRVGEPL